MDLDAKGRCCGRKPLVYKGRIEAPQKFCPRCDRSYDLNSGEQIPNWAWAKDRGGEWVCIVSGRTGDQDHP